MLPQWALNLRPQPFGSDALLSELFSVLLKISLSKIFIPIISNVIKIICHEVKLHLIAPVIKLFMNQTNSQQKGMTLTLK